MSIEGVPAIPSDYEEPHAYSEMDCLQARRLKHVLETRSALDRHVKPGEQYQRYVQALGLVTIGIIHYFQERGDRETYNDIIEEHYHTYSPQNDDI